MERLRGRVLEEGVQLRSAKLTVDDQTFSARSEPGAFTLVLEDDTEVAVRFHSPQVGPTEERRDRWSDLAEDPLAEPFEDDAPGPHVKVSLEGALIRGGDTIVVEGEVARKPKAEGYRGSEETVITAVHPVRIGIGEGADAWLDEQAERVARERADDAAEEVKAIASTTERADPGLLPTRGVLLTLAIGVIAAGVGLGAWLLGLGYHLTRFVVFGVGLQLAIASVFGLAQRRPLPWVKAVGHEGEGRGLLWSRGGAGVSVALGWMAVLLAAIGVGVEAASYAVGATMVVGGTGVVLATLLWWRRRADARALRLLVGGKVAAGDGWGRREGTLVRGSIHWDRTHEMRSSTTTETYTDSEGRSQTRQVTSTWYDFEESVRGGEPLELDVDGERFTIDPEGGSWGTTQLVIRDLKLTGRTRPGDTLAVLGRAKKGAIRMAGPESLFLFGTRGGSAARAARRGLWMHRLAIATLLVLGALGIVVGWINPAQDHLRLPATVVTSSDPAVAAGDECTLQLGYLPGRAYASEPHRCQARMSCGGKTVYGGWSFLGMGYFDCDAEALSGDDGGPDDEDGSIELRGSTGVADHGQGRVSFRFAR